MGQKTHPIGFRLKQTTTWSAVWFANRRNYGDRLVKDIKVRRYLDRELRSAQVSRVEIKRYVGRFIVNVYCVRVGIAVGRGGSRREELRRGLARIVGEGEIHLDFYEEPSPDLSAAVVVNNICAQLEKRINFRRALKQQLRRCEQAGAKGVKLMVAGRLNGAEMSRSEWYKRGRIPLHTLRAKIDYAADVARTTYGSIGVKAWIYTGDVVPKRSEQKAGGEE